MYSVPCYETVTLWRLLVLRLHDTVFFRVVSGSGFLNLQRLHTLIVERSGSGVELRTLDYENPGSNPGCGVKTLGKFFHSTLLQFTQLFK